jgi:hypothetical protein
MNAGGKDYVALVAGDASRTEGHRSFVSFYEAGSNHPTASLDRPPGMLDPFSANSQVADDTLAGVEFDYDREHVEQTRSGRAIRIFWADGAWRVETTVLTGWPLGSRQVSWSNSVIWTIRGGEAASVVGIPWPLHAERLHYEPTLTLEAVQRLATRLVHNGNIVFSPSGRRVLAIERQENGEYHIEIVNLE